MKKKDKTAVKQVKSYKKRYDSPALIRYGNLEKITEGGAEVGVFDGSDTTVPS